MSFFASLINNLRARLSRVPLLQRIAIGNTAIPAPYRPGGGSNVVRHAGARSVMIALDSDEDSVLLQAEDDVHGFDPGQASHDAVELQRLGLPGICERAELLGRQVEIESAPEKGTRLRVSIPLGGTVGKHPHPAG